MSGGTTRADASVLIRRGSPDDAAAIWRLAHGDGVLDRNSPYAYLLLTDLFGATSRVAEEAGRLLGFVAALRPPERPDTAFVWQVGVAPQARGLGLGGRLLDALLEPLPGGSRPRALEATVTPTNTRSDALFRSFARRHAAVCRVVRGYYPAELFPGEGHEREDLYRIEPLSAASAAHA